jgi:SAM-dependent methyltransferase
VLISGAADYGLLAVVLDAVGREGGRPDVAVVDHCGTPLRLCRWYAERFSLGIHTVQCDLAAFRSSDMHDVICAHSLLSCVPVQRHAAIVESWYRLLRPGGILMMANTLYPGTSETKVRFSPEQVAAYGKRVSAAAASCPHPEALPPDRELDRMAEAFGARLSASVVSSQEQLTGLLRGGGFELLEARFGELVKDPHYRRTGPPAATQKEQAWIVARRA